MHTKSLMFRIGGRLFLGFLSIRAEKNIWAKIKYINLNMIAENYFIFPSHTVVIVKMWLESLRATM